MFRKLQVCHILHDLSRLPEGKTVIYLLSVTAFFLTTHTAKSGKVKFGALAREHVLFFMENKMSSVQEWICAKVLSNSKDEFKTFFISMSSRSRPDSCARFMLISEEGPRGFSPA